MKAQSRALGLNKQHINMARLKVKQISDFSSAVQNLIDNDADQNASIIEQISEDLSSEVSATNSDVTSIDAVLASVGGASATTAVSNALSAEISATNSDFVSADTRFSSAESTDVVLSSEINTEKGRIDAILAGSETDLNQFSEVISYVDSLDTADGGALTSSIASLETVVSTNTSSDVVLSTALSSEISATNSDVTSIDAVLASVGGDAAIAAVSDALSSEISATNDDFDSVDVKIGSIDTRFDGAESTDEVLSNALSSEISATDSDVTSLDAYIDGVSADLQAEISATGSEITSLDVALNGFAKEAYIHGAFSDIVTGGGMTAQVVDTTGVQLDGGATATEAAGVVAVDLVQAIEGNNDLEMEANLMFVTINGQYVNHDAIRINSSTQFSLIGNQLGFNLEADDVLEFKYIKD